MCAVAARGECLRDGRSDRPVRSVYRGEDIPWIPAIELGEVAVRVVGSVDVEFPFLDLAPAADVDARVEFGVCVRDGGFECVVGVPGCGPAAEDVVEYFPD